MDLRLHDLERKLKAYNPQPYSYLLRPFAVKLCASLREMRTDELSRRARKVFRKVPQRDFLKQKKSTHHSPLCLFNKKIPAV